MIGGGFIGSEIAAALTMNGCEVTLVFPEAGIGARLFPADLAAFVTDYYREQGVEVLAGEPVASVERHDASRPASGARARGGRRRRRARDRAGRRARGGGRASTVDDGIVVDELGRVGGRDDVFAAGDVARFPARVLGTTMRVEHEDNANSHGRAVGANMAGAGAPYDHLPFFYSDLFELGYEAVGEVDSRHDTVAEWTVPNREGVVCYVDDDAPPARLPALGRLGPGRRRHRPDRRRRADHLGPAARAARLSASRLDGLDVADVVRVDEHVVLAAGREVGEHLVRLHLAPHDVVAPLLARDLLVERPADRRSRCLRRR